MEIEVKETKNLEDGKHDGKVTRVEYRTEPFSYTDVYVKEKETEFELKYGAPTSLTAKSKLGKLLSNFIELKPGEKLDPEKVLVGKKVQFMTMVEKTMDGEFTKIVDGSLKPQ